LPKLVARSWNLLKGLEISSRYDCSQIRCQISTVADISLVFTTLLQSISAFSALQLPVITFCLVQMNCSKNWYFQQ